MARSASPQMFTDWDGLMDDLFHNQDLSGFIDSAPDSSSGIASDSPTLHRPPSSSNSSLSTYKLRSSPDTDVDQQNAHGAWPYRLSNGYSSSSSSNDNVYLLDHSAAGASGLHEVHHPHQHHLDVHQLGAAASALDDSPHSSNSHPDGSHHHMHQNPYGACGPVVNGGPLDDVYVGNAASPLDMLNGLGAAAAVAPPKPARRHHASLRNFPDETLLRIFSNLRTDDLCRCARVSRRWYNLVWSSPPLWTRLQLNDDILDIDRALRSLLKRLSYETPRVCLTLERIDLSGCSRLTNRGLVLVGKRCPELRQLDLKGCHEVSDAALCQVISRCVNLQHLNTTGCSRITRIALTPDGGGDAVPPPHSPGIQIYLRHLDMTDCHLMGDIGLALVAAHCSQLQYVYLRRCIRVGDQGLSRLAASCTQLRELSISDCRLVTDFGLRELSQLGLSLRYVSVAKCEKVSDVGVSYLARHCIKLRYLNVRGCEAVSDDSIELVAQNCSRLKSLDVGKCDVTDVGLETLAACSPQLKKLSLKSCDAITDDGVRAIADGCKRLCQLNIQDCHLSAEAYRYVKKRLKKCIIEHTNPGFY